MIAFRAILLLFLLGLLNIQSNAQDHLASSKEHLHTFHNIDSEVLTNYIDIIADKSQIIGLGEVSHYTKECYQLKHKIIKRLILKGYKGIVLEVDFGQALVWNDYITNGEGNLDSLISKSGWFTYRTEEFKAFLSDLRAYNQTTNAPFQVFGMEMTAMNYNLSWLHEYVSIYLPNEKALIANLKKERPIVAFQSHSKEEAMAYWELYYDITDALTKNQDHLIPKGTEKKYNIATRICEITRQYCTYISQSDFSLKSEFRDQFSARNVMWSMQALGEGSKIAIWAHNGHVTKSSVLFNYNILGHYLDKWFGNEYHSLGFTFNQGSFGAYSSEGFKIWDFPPVEEPSLTKEFSKLNSPFVILDAKSSLQADISPYHSLRQFLPIRTDVSESYNKNNRTMMNIKVADTYDSIIYIDKTQPPVGIKWIN